MVLSSVLDTAALQLQPQFPQLLNLLGSALEDAESKSVPFYALQSVEYNHLLSQSSPISHTHTLFPLNFY